MNSALQSLFNLKKLTNYLFELKDSTSNYSLPLLNIYMKTILNLARKVEGSKKKTEYAPREFFNSIKNENEFREPAGDSYYVVRHFLQKLHEQLMIIKQENNSIFSKYILSAPNNNINNNDMNILNMSINNYVINNKSKSII